MHTNGECWLDTDGQPIQAHGGGVLLHAGVYYWYGENRADWRPLPDGTEQRRALGVSCYRSTDLVRWQNLGVVLSAVDDPSHDLDGGKVIERPKVIYHAAARRFVMWLHVDSADYAAARAGVAVADAPEGPFRYVESFRPNGFMSRDQTLFLDDDGRAYHVCASDENRTTMISLLSDDYLRPSGTLVKCFADRFMEAQAIVKHDGRYHLLASGCTGWEPNEARSAVADAMLGPWVEQGNPCRGPNAALTFGGQSAFILPPGPANDRPIAMLDVWRPQHLARSGYVWLPVELEGGRMLLRHAETWPPRPVAVATG